MNKLDEMIELQEKFRELYCNGLTAVHDDGLHVTEGFFRNNFDDFENIKKDDNKYPYKLETKYKDKKFYCLVRRTNKDENIEKESS